MLLGSLNGRLAVWNTRTVIASKDTVNRAQRWAKPGRSASGALLGALALLAPACGAGSQPPLFDFVAELPFAEIHQETALVDMGTIAGRAHLGSGWSGVDQPQGAANFAWGIGFESTIEFTIVAPRARRFTLRGRPYAPEGSAPRWLLATDVNGLQVAELAVEPGDQRLEVHVPAAAQRVGANWLTLRYALDPEGGDPFDGARTNQSPAIAWNDLVLHDARRHGVVAAVEDGAALEIPVLTRIDYFTAVPTASVLSIDEIEAWGDANDVVLHIEVEPAGEGRSFRHFVRLPITDSVAVPIPDSGGSPVRISFLPTSATTTGEIGLTLVRPVLQPADEGASEPRPGRFDVPTSEATASQPATSSSARGTAPRPPNVVVYLIDALRADHLGAYGYKRPTSPRIDAFAREALVFDNAIANSAWTRSAVASLFTGLFPRSHGVLGRDDALPPDATTLAGLLRNAGYTTAAVATNGNISPGFGFDVGFDFWSQLPEQQTDAIHQYSDVANGSAFDWLENHRGDEPFFLYVHTTDPHEPYTPPNPYRERFAKPTRHGLERPLFERADVAIAADPTLTFEQINADLIDLYDAEIAFNDAQFGAFIDRLHGLDLYDETLIVFLADHGEALLEHGKWGHGTSLYFEQIDIPLMIKLPAAGRGGALAGERRGALSQQVDVLPTILGAAGVDVPAHVQGRSLLPVMARPGAEVHDVIVAELDIDGRNMDSLQTPDLKVIRYMPAVYHGLDTELFDREADPMEHHDLSLARPVTIGYLLSLVRREILSHVRLLAAARGTPDEEILERLRALGYIR